jgi:hypothetical protein
MQFLEVILLTQARLLNEPRIPYRVQIPWLLTKWVDRLTQKRHADLIATLLGADAMEGLMDVGDKVSQKSQRLCSLRLAVFRVSQNGPEALDGSHDTITFPGIHAVA